MHPLDCCCSRCWLDDHHRDPEPADECDAHGKRDCGRCWEQDGEDKEAAFGDHERERSEDR